MSDNPHANGGLLLKDLRTARRDHGVDVLARSPGHRRGGYPGVGPVTDVVQAQPENFRIFNPDRTASNRLQAVFDVTDKQWNREFFGPEVDDHLARDGPW